MQIEFNYATQVVIAIFIVAILVYMFSDKGEYSTDRNKPKDINKGWNLTDEDFNSN